MSGHRTAEHIRKASGVQALLFGRAHGLTFELLESTWCPGLLGALSRHYTGSAGPPPGKKMAWAIHEDGALRGYVGLGEPAFKLAPRRRIGLADARPRPHTVGNFIYRIEAPGPSKASTILRAWHGVAATAWERRYGWAPVHWETLCCPTRGGPGHVVGYCFRRAGYRSLGLTTGRSARRPPGATHSARVWGNSTPKLVLYRGPLARVPV